MNRVLWIALVFCLGCSDSVRERREDLLQSGLVLVHRHCGKHPNTEYYQLLVEDSRGRRVYCGTKNGDVKQGQTWRVKAVGDHLEFVERLPPPTVTEER